MKAIFTGPSLSPAEAARLCPAARIEPPIRRGDLARLCDEGVTDVLMLDGVFAHTLAIAPSEVVDTLKRGARILGAASMGAIRAAECWPAGMQGLGAVHRLYRSGVIRDDDEVAVTTDPGSEFKATSVALISIRYAVLAALRSHRIDRLEATDVLASARNTYFAQRTWPQQIGPAERLDIKRRDAINACAHFAALPPHAPRLTSAPQRPKRSQPHDPRYGHTQAELRELIPAYAELEASGELPKGLIRWYAGQTLNRPR